MASRVRHPLLLCLFVIRADTSCEDILLVKIRDLQITLLELMCYDKYKRQRCENIVFLLTWFWDDIGDPVDTAWTLCDSLSD